MRNIFAWISLDVGSFDRFSLINISEYSEEFLLCPNMTLCIAICVILLLPASKRKVNHYVQCHLYKFMIP